MVMVKVSPPLQPHCLLAPEAINGRRYTHRTVHPDVWYWPIVAIIPWWVCPLHRGRRNRRQVSSDKNNHCFPHSSHSFEADVFVLWLDLYTMIFYYFFPLPFIARELSFKFVMQISTILICLEKKNLFICRLVEQQMCNVHADVTGVLESPVVLSRNLGRMSGPLSSVSQTVNPRI